jgi:hypothetical protein
MSANAHAETLAQIKQDNLHSAALAAKASPELIEQLAIDAMTTTDADLRRKILETLHKVGWSAEPKAVATPYQVANFQIVLDGSVMQTRPQLPTVEEVPPPPLPAPEPVQSPAYKFAVLDDEEYSLLDAVDD